MEELPKKKQSVRLAIALAFGISAAGFVVCVVVLFLFGEHYGWVESQRVHPTPNPVYYVGVLDLVHYSCFWVIPWLAGLFLLIAIMVCWLWRVCKK
jgi:hypothetical protein